MNKPINFTLNKSVNTDRRPSQAIWGDCPISNIKNGEIDGCYFEDDFTDFVLPATQTTAVTQGRYTAYCATAGNWAQDNMPHSTTAGVAGGIVSVLCDTDGDAAALGTKSCPFLLTTTQSGKLWFEARIATDSILTNMGQIFCGLAENCVAAFSSTIPLGNADTGNATAALIGFRRAEDGLGVWDTIYGDHSATQVAIGSSANSTLAAQTWTKLGIIFDPKGDPLRCVRFFVDNVECTTAMTKAALLALTYLDVSGLGPCLAFYADSAGTSDYLYIDWWKCFQTYA